ncbi:MAG: hypothetical protein KIT09_26530 [Bryobacteraceae bacterium]|nr:hypothetical protein [Bryobacteraceae bacterium]
MAPAESPAEPVVLAHPPEELLQARLRRLGEGIGKVVYASDHWVVKRERSPFEVAALIVLWKALRKGERLLPGRLGRRLIQRPALQIRALRLLTQASMLVVPKSIWFTTHVRQMWRLYHARNLRGENLAQQRLSGTRLIPQRVTFPPARVRVGGWPGWLTVSEATQRVESTLHRRLADLAAAGRWAELETWLNRFLDLRRAGWRRGLFSVDAHLKNFGVIGERIVLLDAGGLTNRWGEIESKLAFEEVVSQPHIQLGLGPILGSRPDIAARFDAQWKSTVNRAVVRLHWPELAAR